MDEKVRAAAALIRRALRLLDESGQVVAACRLSQVLDDLALDDGLPSGPSAADSAPSSPSAPTKA